MKKSRTMPFLLPNCQHWRKSCTKCSFWASFMLCLDHVVLLRCCRAYWEAAKPHFGRFQKGCNVILHGRRGTSWHLDVFDKALYTLDSSLHTVHFTLHNPLHSTLHNFERTVHTTRSTLHAPHSTLYAPHSTPHTLITLSTRHSTLDPLYSPQFMLHTPHFTLRTLYSTL